MEKKPVIKLRVYRGKVLNFDENGKVRNENHLISLIYKTKQWELTLKNLAISGYCKVSVEQAFDDKGNGRYEPILDLKEYDEEVQNAFKSAKEIKKTPEQEQIDELKAVVAKLTGIKEPKKEKKEPKKDKLSELKAEYESVVGKKPHHMAGEDKLRSEIEKAKK